MLDSDAKALLDAMASRNIPSYHTMSAAEARAFYRDRRSFTQPDAQPVAAADDLEIPAAHGSIVVRAYRPHGSTREQMLPALVYYHGGGHTIGDLDTHDVLCRELCNRAGHAVFAVDYRMGPEHKFPAAVDDSFAALQWIAQHAQQLAIDAQDIAVGGDSAGANLAAVMALMARDQGGPALAYQLLIYPLTDFMASTASRKIKGKGYLLTTEVLDFYTDCYLDSATDRRDWRLSPAYAADFSGLPPALVLSAGYDPLLDECKDYADRLRAAGNAVEYVCYPGQIHGFILMGRMIAQANEAVALCAQKLKAR